MLGHGYVWNPPPFRPVEGYTNFLWVVLLDGVWRFFGVTPPEAANPISLTFSFLTLAIVTWLVMGIRLRERNEVSRLAFLGLVLVGLAANRTFLTWSSSGLETSMFNFLILLWLGICLRMRSQTGWFAPLLTSCSVLIYLTRPDGVLFIVATVLILMMTISRGKLQARARGRVTAILPLLVVPVHLLWRRATYGEWLPNSYFAKVTSPWPESGLRYAASFTLEYGIWLWMGLALLLLARWGLTFLRGGATGPNTGLSVEPAPTRRVVVVMTLAAHSLYYTLMVGGDHFEYRVYSHLIPLVLVTFVWMLDRLNLKPLVSLGLLLALVLASLPVGWTHWALTRNLTSREETHRLFVPIADRWPSVVRWYARAFDAQQAWLTSHYVCTRHQEHKVNCEFLKAMFPSRADGLILPDSGYPVFAFGAVGVAGWVLPKVNIIDTHGINDYVIARSPVDPGMFRMMGHDRMAPEGYVECFRPNVELLRSRRVNVHPREIPLTAEDIIQCERKWSASVSASR
jgi:arabinofuranosyltransferase